MRVATLQFDPQLGRVEANAKCATEILSNTDDLHNVDLIVGPEMALSGYNFNSLEAIGPYLEPTCAGPTALWAYQTASRYRCLVSIGYPEMAESGSSTSPANVPFALSTSLPEICGKLATESRKRLVSGTPAQYWNYNASLTVDPSGRVVAHYRKSFLYYTDATWALPSPSGFTTVPLSLSNSDSQISSQISGSRSSNNEAQEHLDQLQFPQPDACTTPTAFAICMDLNPQYFTAGWDKRELATHALHSKASMLVVSTAWMTRLPPADEEADDLNPIAQSSEPPSVPFSDPERSSPCCPVTTFRDPDIGSFTYWLDRLLPLIGADKETLVVIANRVGVEAGEVRACNLEKVQSPTHFGSAGSRAAADIHESPSGKDDDEEEEQKKRQIELGHVGAEPTAQFTKLVDIDKVGGVVSKSAHYAGTSVVMALGNGKVSVFGMLGRGEEKVLVADTDSKEKSTWVLRGRGADDALSNNFPDL